RSPAMKMVSSRNPFCRRRIGMISLSAIRVSSGTALALSFIVTCRPNIFCCSVGWWLLTSGDLVLISRGAEKGVSQTRFTRTLRRQPLYVKCRIYPVHSCQAQSRNGLAKKSLSNFFSVQPLCSLCLCGGSIRSKTHHRDTENTELAQRNP